MQILIRMQKKAIKRRSAGVRAEYQAHICIYSFPLYCTLADAEVKVRDV